MEKIITHLATAACLIGLSLNADDAAQDESINSPIFDEERQELLVMKTDEEQDEEILFADDEVVERCVCNGFRFEVEGNNLVVAIDFPEEPLIDESKGDQGNDFRSRLVHVANCEKNGYRYQLLFFERGEDTPIFEDEEVLGALFNDWGFYSHIEKKSFENNNILYAYRVKLYLSSDDESVTLNESKLDLYQSEDSIVVAMVTKGEGDDEQFEDSADAFLDSLQIESAKEQEVEFEEE